MSIQNILVDNNLTLYCKDIEIEGNPAPISQTQTVNLDIYYNDVVVDTKSFTFQKFSVNGESGLCFVKIPPFSVSVSVASKFYIDISSLTNFQMDTLHGQSTVNVEIENLSSNGYGLMHAVPLLQKIQISEGFDQNFTGNQNAGLLDDYILVYRTAAL
ncbi:hypothetical protein A2V49_02145 [candidate division WWE3 bacterium RBG_19FT_COMBO_34_6]|uniref:Uncharacterized protein n=1 Tax=candidate division WWE3 bacterium RBG_19FT_COMBO_34_6 TaxID=1802612 RepID=A0A1F4UKX7_UNCKA|nr:MAG: hypothetical protein A2V49_02145 [candidate division WWE3 bacterium RBG_19FT_COMBO_34_6]